MQTRGPLRVKQLTPRERDCLGLLQNGVHTWQAAANLGISLSTLHKHLASARQKLRVSRTAQALLLYQRHGQTFHHDGGGQLLEGLADGIPIARDFACALQACRTFDEGWSALFAHARKIGVIYMMCGLVAEPPGQLTNGARALRIDLPGDLPQMYRAIGGETVDPMIPYLVTHTRGVLTDQEIMVRSITGKVPKPALQFGEALLDFDCQYTFHQPERDGITGAPLATIFTVSPKAFADIGRDARARETLSALSGIFWDWLQRKGLLRHLAGLTNRQVDALRFAARGFAVAETADHMGVSVRSVEKTLAAARDRLGARTTTAALYRAMMYRALV
jgi:DNA-binding CsgD family transcriptional regulator